MSSADNPTVRPWQEIARELAEQTDLAKKFYSHEWAKVKQGRQGTTDEAIKATW